MKMFSFSPFLESIKITSHLGKFMVFKDHLLFRRNDEKKLLAEILEVRKAFREGFRLCLCCSIVAD